MRLSNRVFGTRISVRAEREIWGWPEIWLCAGSGAQSFAKPLFRVGTSRRLVKKKFEPTVFAPIAKSEHVFFGRAIFAHDSALPIHSLKGSSQLEPSVFIFEICSVIFNFSSKSSFFFFL